MSNNPICLCLDHGHHIRVPTAVGMSTAPQCPYPSEQCGQPGLLSGVTADHSGWIPLSCPLSGERGPLMAFPAQCRLMDSKEKKKAFALPASSCAALNTAQESPGLARPAWQLQEESPHSSQEIRDFPRKRHSFHLVPPFVCCLLRISRSLLGPAGADEHGAAQHPASQGGPRGPGCPPGALCPL